MKTFEFTWDTALILTVAAGCGALGGLTRYATDRKDFWRHILVGLVAAVSTMYVARPADVLGLISGALVFGWAGEVVLASLQARAKVELAEKHASEAKKDVEKKTKEVEKKTKKLASAESDIDFALAHLEGVMPGQSGTDVKMGDDDPAVDSKALAKFLRDRCKERRADD